MLVQKLLTKKTQTTRLIHFPLLTSPLIRFGLKPRSEGSDSLPESIYIYLFFFRCHFSLRAKLLFQRSFRPARTAQELLLVQKLLTKKTQTARLILFSLITSPLIRFGLKLRSEGSYSLPESIYIYLFSFFLPLDQRYWAHNTFVLPA